MKKYIENVIAIILSIITIFYLWNKLNVSGNTIIFILILPALYYFFKKTICIENKRFICISAIISSLISLAELLCGSININFTLDNIATKMTYGFINFFGCAFIVWGVIVNIYNFFDTNTLKNINIGKKIEVFEKRNIAFVVNIILIFIAWLPYFLRYYPGLLTSDSCAQVEQAIGIVKLSNHHPILHTGIISIFVNSGINIVHNINVGVACYTIFQMLIMSVVFSYIIRYLAKKNVPAIIQMIFLLYYMFYPVNALFSVTMWKDVMFAGIIPIFVILCIELCFNTEKFLSNRRNIIIYITISLLMSFMRNNGIYIILMTMPFVILCLKKYWKKISLLFISTIILYFSMKSIIFNVLNVENGKIGEMLSIPLQQIARIEKKYGNELDEETINQIGKFFYCKQIGEKYNPVISDPVKAEFNNEYFNENKLEFIKLWFELLKAYPKDYIESFISNSYGYYYPEAVHWVANRTMENNNLGIEQSPIIEGKFVQKIDSLIERRDIPVISMFFSIGMAFWAIVVCLGYKISKKKYKNIIVFFPIFILWLTIIASPVFCEYRYAYPMFTVLPIYISLCFIREEEKIYGENSSVNTML